MKRAYINHLCYKIDNSISSINSSLSPDNLERLVDETTVLISELSKLNKEKARKFRLQLNRKIVDEVKNRV